MLAQATSPSRSARSGTRPRRPIQSNLYAEDELQLLREQINVCLGKITTGPRQLAVPVHAFPLLNVSPFAASEPVGRIDGAKAVLGENWLASISLVSLLADRLQARAAASTRDPADDATAETLDLQKILPVWTRALELGFRAEILARVSRRSSSMQAWLCGILAGFLGTTKALDSLHLPSLTLGSQFSVTTIDLARLLRSLEVDKRLALPNACFGPVGPWSVVSATAQLDQGIASESMVYPGQASEPMAGWLSRLMSRIPATTLRRCHIAALKPRLDELHNQCLHFARASLLAGTD